MLIRIEDYLHRRSSRTRRTAAPRPLLCSAEPMRLPGMGMAAGRSPYAEAAAIALPVADAVPQPGDLTLLYAEATLL
jgi:hypothetical protein